MDRGWGRRGRNRLGKHVYHRPAVERTLPQWRELGRKFRPGSWRGAGNHDQTREEKHDEAGVEPDRGPPATASDSFHAAHGRSLGTSKSLASVRPPLSFSGSELPSRKRMPR
ncbi:MAG: hypothetical protein NVS9B1_02700 [Candidatus Dormibacteraceae bacterium]